MKSEKNQLLFVGIVLGMLALTVLVFLMVGGEFNFLFIHFSADGVFTNFLWLLPVLMIGAQQLYVLPTFWKAYWKLFSDEEPSVQELYVPVLNENVVYGNDTVAKVMMGGWAIILGMILIMVTPILSFIGSGFRDVMIWIVLFIIAVFLIMSLVRGVKYMAIRQDIYDLHNKYLGMRGTSPFAWMYKVLYFIPLGRSISLLTDIQVLDKLTKFNDIEQMKTELVEED